MALGRASGRAVVAEGLESRVLFAFGVTTTATTYVVDNGGDLQFTVLKNGATVSSTVHLGDITSIKYKGKEMLATYAVTSRHSHYEQGLGSTSTISFTIGPGNQWIKVTCDNSNDPGSAIQWYVVRPNDNNIYMASLPTDVTAGPGEGRYIAYLDRNVFSAPEEGSDLAGNTGAIEGSDVFGFADGTTASKFYNNGRGMIDNVYHGLTGSATGTPVGAWMFMGNREHSAGGPFFKDIDFQANAAVEIYNVVFSGHTQTEAYRQGLQGPYSLQFTNGSAPTLPDYTFLEGVGITGLVPMSARGTLTGVASGTQAGQRVTVGLSNSAAQYWGTPNVGGSFTIAGVKPGTYKMTLYSQELEVGTRSVTITAGQTTTANIVSSFYYPSPANTVFRIGTWDGTPLGFLNADKIEVMHPQDVRMSSWTSTPTFTVGTNTDSQWPMIQFMGVNNSQRIVFNLTAGQVQNVTLRIGVTQGFAGGRNKVTVNSGQTYAWTSANPTATADLNSRGVTRGTWRGPNQQYVFNIPSTALRAGTNTIDLPVISGSFVAGATWLSPNVCYDAIDLVYTTAAAPSIASVVIAPTNAVMGLGSSRAFAAVAKNAAGVVVTTNTDWVTTGGVVDGAGTLVAPTSAGTYSLTGTAIITRTPGYSVSTSSSTVIASTVSGSGSTTVTVVNSTLIVDSLVATPRSNTQIDLSWFDGSVNESGFRVERSVDGVNFGLVATLPAGSTGYSSVGLSAGTTYTFRVRAFNATTEGANFAVAATTFTSPRAWWKLNEASGSAFADASGGGFNGTAINGPVWVAGRNGNALSFDGTNDHASVPAGSISGLTSFSVSLWANLTATPTWSRLFDFGTGTTNYMFLTPRGSSGFARFAIRTGAVSEQGVNANVAIPTGGWVHTVVSLSGGVVTMYLNGVQIGQASGITLTPSSLGATTQNWLGRSQFSSDPYLSGAVDDFRIYAGGLDASQALALYNQGANGNLAPTVATPATATPANLSTASTSLSVLGADDGGESNLSYTWSVVSGPGSAQFASATSKNTTVTFSQTGSYVLQAGFRDAEGLITTSNVSVNVVSLATSVGTAATVDFTGLTTAGTFRLRRNVGQQFEFLSGGSVIYTFAPTTTSLRIVLGGGADGLTVDTVNGDPIPAGGLSLDAGAGANTLAFAGSVAPGSTLTASSNTVTLGSVTPSLSNLTLVIASGATLVVPTTVAVGTLSLAGGQAMLVPGSDAVLRLGALAVSGGSKLDIADNSVILDYTGVSPVGGVRAMLSSAYTGGTWAGTGITSSVAAADVELIHSVASAEASELLALVGGATDVWHGQVVDSTAVLLRYTFTGDTDLSDALDGADLANSIEGLSTGGSGWTTGDFDFDGVANAADYQRLLTAYTLASGPRAGPGGNRGRPVAMGLGGGVGSGDAVSPVVWSAEWSAERLGVRRRSAVFSDIAVDNGVVLA